MKISTSLLPSFPRLSLAIERISFKVIEFCNIYRATYFSHQIRKLSQKTVLILVLIVEKYIWLEVKLYNKKLTRW